VAVFGVWVIKAHELARITTLVKEQPIPFRATLFVQVSGVVESE
jgi:hypothetical protein